MASEPRAEAELASVLRHACAELERRLGAGESCDAESMFASYPELRDDPNAALELIYTEFVAREHAGQRPRPEDFCTRFGQWRAGLAQLFQIHAAVDAGASVIPAEPSSTPFPPRERLQALTTSLPDDGLRRIGNYEVLGEIGRGGMGVVYKARQVGLNRLVALKMIRTGADAGPRECARFRAEAEASARLQHPNIVQIHEIGRHDSQPFLVLEYVDGGNLEDRLTGAPWPAAESARLVETLARAMHYAHQQGIVHRDLKPGNVLFKDEGRKQQAEADRSGSSLVHLPSSLVPKIADFGLARRLPLARVAEQGCPPLTADGAILGTPAYMAPEQAARAGPEVGPAADLYALGAILYELLTGRPPFQGVSLLEILEQVRTCDPLPPSRLLPGLPRDIETICMTCLRKEPAQRFASAAGLADDLGRFLGGEPIHARPTPAWERAWKWAKRRPAVAGLLAALVFLAIVGLTSVTILWRQTAAALATVKIERDEKEAALGANLIALAHREWLAFDLDAARRHLDECPETLRNDEWRYLERVCHAERARLRGHKWGLTAIAFSPDGRRLLSAGRDSMIKLWDVARQEKVWEVPDKYPYTTVAAFSADGTHIVLVTLSGPARDPQSVTAVCAVDSDSGRELWRWQYNNRIDAVALSPDQQHAALADHTERNMRVVELPSGRVTASVPLDARFHVFRQAFSPDGRRIASLLRGGGILMWDAQTGAPLSQLKFPSTEHCQVAFSPDGGKVANAINDRVIVSQIVLYNVQSSAEIRRFPLPINRTSFLVFSPDGRSLASASNVDREVFLWDVETGQELLTFRGHLSGVTCLAFSPDSRFLATGGEDLTVRIWDTRLPEGAWRTPSK